MKQLVYLLAFGLVVPSAALARVDANVAAQCQDARDYFGFVRAFTTPSQHSDDIAPLAVVVGQLAAGLLRHDIPHSSHECLPEDESSWSC